MYTKQNVFLGYMMLQLLCGYNTYMLHVMFFPMFNVLYIYISTSLSKCTVLSMAVFCSSLMSCFPGMRIRHFLNDSEMVPLAHTTAGVSVVVTFHMRCISTVKVFRIFSASFLIKFPSPDIAISVNMNVPFSFSRIMMAGLLLEIVLSVFPCWFHQMVTLSSEFFLLILVHAHTTVPCLILPLFLCMWKSVVD